MSLQQCLRGGEVLDMPRSALVPDTISDDDGNKMGFTFPITSNTSITLTYHATYAKYLPDEWWSSFTTWLRSVLVSSKKISTGARSERTFSVSTSTKLNDTAEVVVASAGGATICRMEGRDGHEIGIGIFTSNSYPSSPQVSLALPDANGPHSGRRNRTPPTTIRALTAYLPNFVIELAGNVTLQTLTLSTTNGPVSFESGALDVSERLTLQTTNGAISVANASAPDVSFVTTNGGISGTFNASKSLTLRTTNAPINVTVGLASAENAERDTSAWLTTTNAFLNATLHLSSDAPRGARAGRGGRFIVTASTSNRPIFVAVPTAPKLHKLALSARTTNARAEARLPLEYEGSFSVQSTQPGSASVQRAHEDDKEKDSRKLSVTEDARGRYVRGTVYTNDVGQKRGRADVGTSNAKALLVV